MRWDYLLMLFAGVAGATYTNDTSFEFFQDYDECPIGIYTTYSYGLPCPKEFCP